MDQDWASCSQTVYASRSATSTPGVRDVQQEDFRMPRCTSGFQSPLPHRCLLQWTCPLHLRLSHPGVWEKQDLVLIVPGFMDGGVCLEVRMRLRMLILGINEDLRTP